MKRRIDTIDQADRVYLYLEEAIKTGPQMVTIVDYKPSKTEGQNALVHIIIRVFAKQHDRTEKAMELLLLDHLGYYEPIERKNGTIVKKYLDFADVSREEISEIIDRMKALAIEYDVKLTEI